MVSVKAIAVASILPVAYAQTQTLWGQCSGVTYKGPIECPNGATCTVYNPYYGQCIPAATTTPPPPTKTTTTARCTSSLSTCTTVALPVPCGTSVFSSTYCSAYCATATPPIITIPASDLVKRCIPSPTTTGCRTTTSTCTTVALPIACGTGVFLSTYCSTYCASTSAPPRITVPAAALEKRCMPPITTTKA
ncbi:hypothetical protein TWF506_006900 [Arthrobotrys conoides]|uniref:CBM1 domain-containing protein n=1 Tax=Arthrobotrys conoides TaxID=74498 RepID=A0AAN8RVQ7_9PEZI